MTHTKIQRYEDEIPAHRRRAIDPIGASRPESSRFRIFVSLCEALSPLAYLRFRVSLSFLLAATLIAGGFALTANALFIQAKAALAQVLLDQAWQATLATHRPTKAWRWADTWPVARIEFPRLKQSAIVLSEGGGEALAFGPAHVAASAKPGESGTTVIAAHRDTHFSYIKDLKPGDHIDVTTPAGKTVRYRMTGSAIVHAQASGITTQAKSRRLALVTCYPFDGFERGPLRYIVFAEAL